MAKNITTYGKLLAELILETKHHDLNHALDSFALLLKEDGAALSIDAIIAQAEKVITLSELEKTVTIYSATPLTLELKKSLVEKVNTLVARPIIEEVVDPSLLAGVRVDLPSGVIDGSLSGRLKKLAVSLNS